MAEKSCEQLSESEQFALNVVSGITNRIVELRMKDQFDLCHSALKMHNSNLRSYDTKQEKINRRGSISENLVRNQYLRFGIGDGNNIGIQSSRTSWTFFGGISIDKDNDPRNYEEVLAHDILNAPICDICVVQSKADIPHGYYRMYKTPDNKKADLNSGNGGSPLYLCIKKDLTGKLPIISNFIIVLPDRNEYVPAGYYAVSRVGTQNPCNLNTSTNAERIYLCFRKDIHGSGNPITDVQIMLQSKGVVSPPKAFHIIEKSISGIDANLNTGTNGTCIYFCYRQKMSRLNLLLIEADSEEVAVIQSKLKLRRNTLRSFDDSDTLSFMLKRREASEGYENTERPRTQSFVYDSSIKDSHSRNTSSSNALHSLEETIPDHHSDDASSIQSASTESFNVDKIKLSQSAVWEEQASNVSSPTSILHSPSKLELKDNDPDLSTKAHVRFGNLGEKHKSDLKSRVSFGGGSGEDCDSNIVDEHTASIDEGVFELMTYDSQPQEFDDEFFQYDEEMSYLLAQQQQHKDKEVVDAFGITPSLTSRRSLLAILSSIYIRHGSISGSALAGLNDLFQDSDFFTRDLQQLPASCSTTMVDVTIEVVCDRVEVASDGERDSLLRFLSNLTKYAGSKLSLFSLQRIYRAISFLCSHYAFMYNFSGDDLMDGGRNGVEKGMHSFKLFSKLLTDVFDAAEKESIPEFLPNVLESEEQFYILDDMYISTDESSSSSSHRIVEGIVSNFISEVLNALELSHLNEVAHITISKQSYSTVSTTFWKEVTALSNTFFEQHGYRSIFTLMCAICKQAWYTVRTKSGGNLPINRDVQGKLVALSALEQFCLLAGENVRKSKILGYQVRRIMIPCLMYNITFSFLDENIFRKILRIITALWTRWRWHIRIEFAIICEQFIFKVMQASVIQIRPIFKRIIIQEVIQWFEQRQMLLEMFVNYDMDGKFVSQWNTFSYLVRTLCTISRRLVYSSPVERVKSTSHHKSEVNFTEVSIRDVHMQALEEVAHMSKTLMDASGHAYLMIQDERFRDKSLSTSGGWTEDAPQSIEKSNDNLENQSKLPSPFKLGSIKVRRAVHQESEKLIEEAVKIYLAKNDLKKAVSFLIDKNFIGNTPQEIANFLRVYKNKFDSGAIGEFLGEGGRNQTEEDYWSQIRFRYTRAVSFVELDIEPALRLYLTGCGFRLPGEAQKINRFVEAFVKAFWQDNSGTVNCPFKQPDTAHMLAYAIIMLNTDLHRVNLDKKKKKGKMTKEEFTKNLRGIDEGNDVDKEYLSRIYDNIAAVAIELATGTTSSNANKTIDESMIQKRLSPEVRIAEEQKFVSELTSSIRDSEDLLRSLAPFTFRFNMENTDTKMSLDLVSFMYESVWFHFHATSEALLNSENCDITIKSTALEILQYSLTSAIFLDLKVERMTLVGLLSKFRDICETLPNASRAVKHPKIQDNSWYDDIESAIPSMALDTISKLHHLIVYIKAILKENNNYELAKLVSEKIERKARIMEQNSYFVLEGDLSKMNRTGKAMTYRFYLFSDQLIYAHYSRNEYKVHEQLSLLSMKVTDVPSDPSQCSFFIDHPTKSFLVITEDSRTKQQWLQALNQTIISCNASPFNINKASNENTNSSGIAFQNPIRHRGSTSISPIRNRLDNMINRSKDV